MSKDRSGNTYIDVDNVRVTLVPAASRSHAKNWAGADVLRIAAYRGDGTNCTHWGAELPVCDGAAVERFFDAIRRLLKTRAA